MLSDDALDRLMQPIIDRQESINSFVLDVIADRINQIGTMTPRDLYNLQRLLQSGADVRLINAELARLSGLQVTDIKRMIKIVAYDS